MTGLTCVLTVHGVDFQQPPVDDPQAPRGKQAGYVDPLHAASRSALGARPGDDPNRAEHAVSGPVHAQSSWNDIPEEGLKRLLPKEPLVGDDRVADVAHVALVHAASVIDGPRLASVLDTLARTAPAFDDYAHPLCAVHLLAADQAAALHHQGPPGGAPAGSLRPRNDLRPAPSRPPGHRLLHLANPTHRTHLGRRPDAATVPPTRLGGRSAAGTRVRDVLVPAVGVCPRESAFTRYTKHGRREPR